MIGASGFAIDVVGSEAQFESARRVGHGFGDIVQAAESLQHLGSVLQDPRILDADELLLPVEGDLSHRPRDLTGTRKREGGGKNRLTTREP